MARPISFGLSTVLKGDSVPLNIFSNKLFVILTSGTTGYKKSAGTGALHLTGGYRRDGSANIVRT